MMFEQKYSIEEVEAIILPQVSHLIMGVGRDPRAQFFFERIRDQFNGIVVRLGLDVRNSNQLQVQWIHRNVMQKTQKGFLCRHLERIVKESLQGETICLDMSGMEHQLLFFLLKVLKRVNVARLFVVYTEPDDYTKDISDEDHYTLTEEFLGIGAAKGYVQRKSSDSVFIPVLGFERARFQRFYEEIQPPND
ncbi:MAG: hypothetical protein WAW23_02235, partial [Candidatus Methanoperedens sp.]